MRKLSSLALVALIVLSFGACTLSPPSMGHLSISVPLVASSTASKTLGSSARGVLNLTSADDPAIRIYVLLNGTFIPSVGKEFFQYPLSAADTSSGSNTFSIDLAPATNYQVYVAIGSTANGWATKYYGATDPFTVSSGVYTNENLSVASNVFTITPSATPAFATVVNGGLWKLINSLSPSGQTFSQVNSLSVGEWWNGATFSQEPWVNTDTGIFNGITGAPRLSASGVKASVAFSANIGSTNNALVIGYYGSDVGVAYSNDSTSTTATGSTWTTGSLNSYLNSPDGSSLKNLITDLSKFVYATAFVFNGGSSYGFAATSLGCYFYNSSVQNQIGTDPTNWIQSQLTSSNSQYALFAMLGSKSETITSLALDFPLDTTANPTKLYAGTGAGLYYGTVSATGNAPALSSVTGSTKSIQILTSASFGGNSYAAYVDSSGTLTVLKQMAPFSSYPFYSFTALPTGVTGLVFYYTGSALELVVSCQDGLVVIPIS